MSCDNCGITSLCHHCRVLVLHHVQSTQCPCLPGSVSPCAHVRVLCFSWPCSPGSPAFQRGHVGADRAQESDDLLTPHIKELYKAPLQMMSGLAASGRVPAQAGSGRCPGAAFPGQAGPSGSSSHFIFILFLPPTRGKTNFWDITFSALKKLKTWAMGHIFPEILAQY